MKERDRYGDRDGRDRQARGVLPGLFARRSKPDPDDSRASDHRRSVVFRLLGHRRRSADRDGDCAARNPRGPDRAADRKPLTAPVRP